MEHEPCVSFVTLSGMDSPKPLICESFRQARVAALHFLRKRHPGNKVLFEALSQSSSPGISYSSVSFEHNNNNNNNNNNIINNTDNNSSTDSSLNADDETARLRLFPYTPSVAEPPRHSNRGLLNETESLQLKHSAEYEFLVPAIGSALTSTVTAHEVWRKQQEELRQRRYSAGDELPSVVLLTTPRNVANTSVDNEFPSNNEKTLRELFSVFETTDVPPISLQEYVRRMTEYAYVSPSILLIACLYIDRLLTRHPSFLLSPTNVFKFFATSVRVSSKVMDTRTLNNKDFARISGFSNTEMNILEVLFIQALELDLFVGAEDFYKYAEDLIAPTTISRHSDSHDVEIVHVVRSPSVMSESATPPHKRFLAPIHRTSSHSNSSNSRRNRTLPDTLPPVNSSRILSTPVDSKSPSPSKSTTSTTTLAPVVIGVGCHSGRGNGCSTTTLSWSRSTTVGLPVPAPPRRASCLPVASAKNSTTMLCSIGDTSTSARGWDRLSRERVEERFVR
ncbi:cyclin-dependent protein kinase [Trypanosoma theileri]|uniref:Cyclin-dependent protein kinase n=1 Tax=Trypanosoma theileri TaxID=67003 RepID=A0A1X0NVV0_9TRYP|nr:cyclin-dependent protein kinase [Trypanosoma theileri]ORC88836.1 cyclin-dependent protein kinase [Trypanosoma theileri]